MGLSLVEVWADVLQRPFILVGMLAMLLLTSLTATSFNRVVRWKGAKRWQALHKAVYLVAVLAMIHFTWMRAGKNHYGEVWLYGAVLALLLAWRWRRWRQRRLV
jgi:sulfoxide reductase heme-binding subunit YedZ